jgi:hypothetical protein
MIVLTDTESSVFPGNTYDYAPFNASVQSQMYNNLYGTGNCVDQIKDCAARGLNEICESAVCKSPKDLSTMASNKICRMHSVLI